MNRVKTQKTGFFRAFDGRLHEPSVWRNMPSIRDNKPYIGPFVGLNGPLIHRVESMSHCPRPPSGFSTNQGGLTLIELMAALAVAAVLLTLAVPSFKTLMEKSRLTTVTNDFVAAVNLARSEAIKRDVTVIMCRSGDPTATSPVCGGTGSSSHNWSSGWILYATNGSNVAERDYNSATDVLIQRGSAAATGVTIKSNDAGNSWLTFHSDGTLQESGNATYAVCDENKEATGRLITILRTGRPAISTTSPIASCSPT